MTTGAGGEAAEGEEPVHDLVLISSLRSASGDSWAQYLFSLECVKTELGSHFVPRRASEANGKKNSVVL